MPMLSNFCLQNNLMLNFFSKCFKTEFDKQHSYGSEHLLTDSLFDANLFTYVSHETAQSK